MKHIATFNGAVTSKLHSMGLNSKAVLCACNAWRGSVKGEETKSGNIAKVKLTGTVNKSGEDKRTLTVSDKTSITAKKLEVTMPGLLVAISDGLTELTDKLGISVGEITFPDVLVEWLEGTPAFRPKTETTANVANPVPA